MYDFSSKILHLNLGYICVIQKRRVTRPILIMPDKNRETGSQKMISKTN